MSGILEILSEYEGGHQLLILYLVCLVYLWRTEKDADRRMVLVYLPFLCLILFLLPPVYKIYGKLDSARTYYRLLWMLPMSVSIVYSGVKLVGEKLWAGLAILCGLIICSGQFVYSNENILKAENRLHLPQMVLDISDYLMNETGGRQTMAAMPVGLVQFVRQYNSDIMMPYGREMQMGSYYNEVYEAMEQSPVDVGTLCRALDKYDCEFLVIEATKEIRGSLEDEGLDYLADVDGYRIWHCPYAQEFRDAAAKYQEEAAGQEDQDTTWE